MGKGAQTSDKNRKYPAIYEKAVPIALAAIAVAIVVLLVIILVVVLGQSSPEIQPRF